MKLPAKPTKPYIKHKPQTLRDVRNSLQEIEPDAGVVGGRSAAMNSRSAALTRGISSGRLRNQIQKNEHHRAPIPASAHKQDVQWPRMSLVSHRTRNGASAPPRRVHVQFNPCAKPRCRAGTQSAITRARMGNPPA